MQQVPSMQRNQPNRHSRSIEHNRRVQRIHRNYLKGMSVEEIAADEDESAETIQMWLKDARAKELTKLRRDNSVTILVDDVARIELAIGAVMTRIEPRDTAENVGEDGTVSYSDNGGDGLVGYTNALAKLVDLKLDILGLRKPPEGQATPPALVGASTSFDDPDGWHAALQAQVQHRLELETKLGIIAEPAQTPSIVPSDELVLDSTGVELPLVPPRPAGPPNLAVPTPPLVAPPPLGSMPAAPPTGRGKF